MSITYVRLRIKSYLCLKFNKVLQISFYRVITEEGET